MKFFFLPFVCLLLVFGSCKKKGDIVPTNTISATIDGANVNFNGDASDRIVTNALGLYANLLDITGSTGADGNRATIVITITSKNSITNGTVISSDNGADTFSDIIYEKTDPISQIAQPYITDNFGHYPTVVTITSISNTNIQGTFN